MALPKKKSIFWLIKLSPIFVGIFVLCCCLDLFVKSISKCHEFFFFHFQQDGPAILSQMEPSSKQFAEGVFPTFRQWAIHRCTFGHWKQKYSVSQSGFICLLQLLWTSIFDFWWEKSNHHSKGYLVWWYLGLSRVHVPWRNQCRPGKLQQAYCLRYFFYRASTSLFSRFLDFQDY